MSLAEKLGKLQPHGTQLAGAALLGRIARTVLSVVFSFETLFALYLFAGRYKADPRFQWVPVDLTALFFVLSILAGISVLWRRGFKVRRRAFELVLLALAFVAYVLASLAWTPGWAYASQKALYISTLTLWPLVACAVIIAQEERRLVRFLVLVLLFAGWMAIEATVAYLRAPMKWLVYALGGNYLGLGRVVGFGTLITLAYRLFFTHTRFQKVTATVFVGYHSFVLLILGGRGPFLAALLGASAPLLLGIRVSISGRVFLRRYAIPLLTFGAAFIIVVVYLFESGAATVTLRRLLKMGPEGSVAVRLKFFASAIDLWLKSPLFGQGIGSFPVLAGAADARLYPHNLVLETLAELGLVGLFLFSMVVIYAFKTLGPLDTIRRDPFRILILMLFVNVFFNAMVSGDIPDNRIVFGVLGLMTLTMPGGSR